MATKAQHSRGYQRILPLLRELREKAGLTQRGLGKRLKKPQSWVYNCETGNRRMDVTEVIAWARACEANPEQMFREIVKLV
jgi:transcriptional regulator with XRE-family HTH domain